MMDKFDDVLQGKRLVFLVGAPRSGTTWLQLLLSRSPSVVTGPETHIFSLFLRSMVDQWRRIEKSGERIGLNQVLSEEEFRCLLRDISGCVLAKMALAKTSATVVLEKTPNHVYCWREILSAWPEAHFIHIIRDPRSVVASLRVASRTWASDWASSKVLPNCERWNSDVSDGREIKSATPNYQEIGFQELIDNGPEVLMKVFAKLGIQSSLQECQQYFDECKIENLKAGNLKNAPFDVAKMNKESFRIGSSESWQSELSAMEVTLIERVTGPLMTQLGFKRVVRNRVASSLLEAGCTVTEKARMAKRSLKRLAARI